MTVHQGSFTPGILLVDDDEAHRLFANFAISRVVSKEAIFEASTVAEARSLLHSTEFLVMIFDIRLGSDSGFTLLSEARDHLKLTIPIIMISTSELDSDVKESYSRGANCFLHKGSSPEEFQRDLVAALRFFLALPSQRQS